MVEYVHDPLGRRIAKKVNGSFTEKYLWHHGLTTLLAVFDGSDNLLMRFEYADGRMPVSMTRSDGTYYFTYDQIGSLRAVANTTGTVVKIIDYDSFGNIINDTNPSFEVPFGFAGGLHDRDTDLVRFAYRDYDPDIGRWTAKDPILFAGGNSDLYGYCINDPVNETDPHGLIIGSVFARIAGKILGSTPQEAGIAGKVADSIIGSVLAFNGDVVPATVRESAFGVLTALQGWGAYQTASLGFLSIGFAPAWFPASLSGLAGIEIGLLFNQLYEHFSGQALGSDIYDWLHPQKREESSCQ